MNDISSYLKNIETIPLPYRSVFQSYPCFNTVQSEVLHDVLNTDKSIVISAPTGSGKTVIFELAIIRLLMENNEDEDRNSKIIYISPMKALCQERLLDWYRKFSEFDLKIIAITGDSDNLDFKNLMSYNIIISTPEKWDSLTRRWTGHREIMKLVKLFMIDEVHLLNEDFRGSTLEVIVCRMKTISALGDEMQQIRIIGVSASIPNIEDIAEWIGKENTRIYKFSEDIRPVPLKKIVLGYPYNPGNMSAFKFDLSLNYKLKNLLIKYSNGKPTLIFCSTRKSVEMTAKHLVSALKIKMTLEQRENLELYANRVTDSKARECLKHGIGYHHGGMIPETKHIIEDMFRNGHLPVLVTTSTLAMGVNLPAHLIIIKSTKTYINCELRDYNEIAIQQMIGRAGRPQFDTSATAIVLTTDQDKTKFEKMVQSNIAIESNLHRHLTEHLNAEIVLGTITSLDVAMDWLASTFLHVRARKNPHHYGLNVELSEQKIDKKLLEICQIDLNKLVKARMITMDETVTIKPTEIGEIMANYYVAFETMRLFTQLSGEEILMQILSVVSKCHEFSDIRLRINDKKTLNSFNKSPCKIRFPLKGNIQNAKMKVNCIIQAVFGNLEIQDHSLISESMAIIRNGRRIVNCLIQYLGTRKPKCYNALLNSILLGKCFQAKLWENSAFVSKQLNGIGNSLSSELVNAGKTDFNTILMTNPREIETIVNRRPPFGDNIIEEVRYIPRYSMNLEIAQEFENFRKIKLTIELVNVEDIQVKSTINLQSVMILLIGNEENFIILYEKYKHSFLLENTILTKFLDIKNETGQIEAHFISEDWVGIDCTCKILPPKTQEQNYCENSAQTNDTEYMDMFLDMYKKIKMKKANDSNDQEKKTKEAKTPAKKRKNNGNNRIINAINQMKQTSIESTLDIGLKQQDKLYDTRNITSSINTKKIEQKSCQFNWDSLMEADPTYDKIKEKYLPINDTENLISSTINNSNDEEKKNQKELKTPVKKLKNNTIINAVNLMKKTNTGSEPLRTLQYAQNNDTNKKNFFDWDSSIEADPTFNAIKKRYLPKNITESSTSSTITSFHSSPDNKKRKYTNVSSSTEPQDHDINEKAFHSFKMKNRTQFTHDEAGYNKNTHLSTSMNVTFYEQQTDVGDTKIDKKILTWRSPLVASQEATFSPPSTNCPIRPQVKTQNQSTVSSASTSTQDYQELSISYPRSFSKANQNNKLRGSQFLLSDKDNCEDLNINRDDLNINRDNLNINNDALQINHNNLNINNDDLNINNDDLNINCDDKKKLNESYLDICSTSLLDELGIQKHKNQPTPVTDLHNSPKYFPELKVPREKTNEEPRKVKHYSYVHKCSFDGKENIPKIARTLGHQRSNLREIKCSIYQGNPVSTCVQDNLQYKQQPQSVKSNVIKFDDIGFEQLRQNSQTNYDLCMHSEINSISDDQIFPESYQYSNRHNKRGYVNNVPNRPNYEQFGFNTYSSHFLPRKYCERNCICYRPKQPTMYTSSFLVPPLNLNQSMRNQTMNPKSYHTDINTDINYFFNRNSNSSFYREKYTSQSGCVNIGNDTELLASNCHNQSIPDVKNNNFSTRLNASAFCQPESIKHLVNHNSISQTDNTMPVTKVTKLKPGTFYGSQTDHSLDKFVMPKSPSIYDTLGRKLSYNTNQNCSEICNCQRDITDVHNFSNPYDTRTYAIANCNPCNTTSPYFHPEQYNNHPTSLISPSAFIGIPYTQIKDEQYRTTKFFGSPSGNK